LNWLVKYNHLLEAKLNQSKYFFAISDPNGKLSDVLRQAVLPLLSPSDCVNNGKRLHESKICAGGKESASFQFCSVYEANT
jgi:hypothetical protein